MRLGLFGGTFDPVHYGHLLVAEFCREAASLDSVWFVPAAVPPHKQQRELTSGSQRVQMLRLAVGGHGPFEVSSMEVERGGVSYTVETLAEVARQQPDSERFLLLGADSLHDLPNWREPGRICELATPLIVDRPGAGPLNYGCLAGLVNADRLQQIRQLRVVMPQIDLSSRELRRRVGAGLSIRFQTPRAVEKYIETAGLYRQ